jgi:hypothetical protein
MWPWGRNKYALKEIGKKVYSQLLVKRGRWNGSIRVSEKTQPLDLLGHSYILVLLVVLVCLWPASTPLTATGVRMSAVGHATCCLCASSQILLTVPGGEDIAVSSFAYVEAEAFGFDQLIYLMLCHWPRLSWLFQDLCSGPCGGWDGDTGKTKSVWRQQGERSTLAGDAGHYPIHSIVLREAAFSLVQGWEKANSNYRRHTHSTEEITWKSL